MTRPIACRGEQRAVVYAVVSGGKSPAQEFVENLDVRSRAKMLKLFQMLGDRDWIKNREQFKVIEGTGFYEFKFKQIRMPCYRDGLRWVVTHGFFKKGNRIDPEEIRRAERIRSEDSQWTENKK